MSCDQENRQQGNRWQTTCRYSRRDQAAIDAHIARYFGAGEVLDRVELSPGVALELLLIPPRPEADHDYYTVITRGLGAWDDCPVLVELLVNLPSDWLLDEEALRESRWGWPVRMLADAARRMGRGLEPEWGMLLAWPGENLAPGTRLCGGVLFYPGVFGEASFYCPLPDSGGNGALFLQLVPLYPEEMEEAEEEERLDRLLARCPDELLEVIDPRRPNLILDEEAICYEEELVHRPRPGLGGAAKGVRRRPGRGGGGGDPPGPAGFSPGPAGRQAYLPLPHPGRKGFFRLVQRRGPRHSLCLL